MKIPCKECHRKVAQTQEAMLKHILRYHPHVPFWRLARLFDPRLIESIGYRVGELLKRG